MHIRKIARFLNSAIERQNIVPYLYMMDIFKILEKKEMQKYFKKLNSILFKNRIIFLSMVPFLMIYFVIGFTIGVLYKND